MQGSSDVRLPNDAGDAPSQGSAEEEAVAKLRQAILDGMVKIRLFMPSSANG